LNSALTFVFARLRYQLLQPEPRYQRYFRTVQSKFDVCTGIYKLMEADKKLSYADVVAHVRALPRPSLCPSRDTRGTPSAQPALMQRPRLAPGSQMHDRYGITEDFLVKEAASVLKGLLEAYPEYRTTPFFRKLVRLPSRALRDSTSLVGWWVVGGPSSLRNALTRFVFFFVRLVVGASLAGPCYCREEPLGQAQNIATEGEGGGPRRRVVGAPTSHLPPSTFTSSCSSRQQLSFASWLTLQFQSTAISTRRRRRLCHHCKTELSAMDHQKCNDCRKYEPTSPFLSLIIYYIIIYIYIN